MLPRHAHGGQRCQVEQAQRPDDLEPRHRHLAADRRTHLGLETIAILRFQNVVIRSMASEAGSPSLPALAS